jgi:HEAT repeat protein
MALGVLAHESTVGRLCELLRDTPAARKTLGGKAVPERTRAFAGMALGLLGSQTKNEDLKRFIVHHLVQQLHDEQGAQPDTQVACVLALGLTPLSDVAGDDAAGTTASVLPPSASLSGEVGLLLALLDDSKTPIYVRAHLPRALARLAASTRAHARVTRVLLDCALDRNEKAEVAQGCVLALGSLAHSGSDELDVEVREALVHKMATGESQARCFATIALAQFSARDEDGPNVEATRALLLDSMTNGRSTRERCWSALGLGVLEHGRGPAAVLPKSVGTALARGLREAKSPEEVGALAIGCGLAGAQAALPVLLDHLASVKEVRASGYVALALGMLGAPAALEPLRAMLDEARTCSEKLPQTALALTVLEDPLLVARLLGLLDSGTSQSTKQAAAIALGAVGDRRVVDPLLTLLHDDSSNASTRGAVIVALGRVGDRDRLPWQAAVSAGLNYRAMTVTLSDENHSGLLDVR